MKLIKRSEMIESKSDYIAFDTTIDCEFEDTNELNSLSLIQTRKENGFNDYVVSNLFDVNTDIFSETNDCHKLSLMAINKLNNLQYNQSLPVTYKQTSRDGFFLKDDEAKIYVLEYEEIKQYMLLFIRLFNQDIYEKNRIYDKLQIELNSKEEVKNKKLNKI